MDLFNYFPIFSISEDQHSMIFTNVNYMYSGKLYHVSVGISMTEAHLGNGLWYIPGAFLVTEYQTTGLTTSAVFLRPRLVAATNARDNGSHR